MRNTSVGHAHLRLAAVDGEIILIRAGEGASTESRDRELFLLRDELRAVCDAMNEAKPSQADSLVTRVTELARVIATTPAHTLAGVKAKANALRWVHLGDGEVLPLDFKSNQGQVYVSLLNDLHRLDAEAR